MADVEETRLRGKIAKIHIQKGYGFIAGDDKKDYFFHMSAVMRSTIAFRHLKVGDPVIFTPIPGNDPKQCMKCDGLVLDDQAIALPMTT